MTKVGILFQDLCCRVSIFLNKLPPLMKRFVKQSTKCFLRHGSFFGFLQQLHVSFLRTHIIFITQLCFLRSTFVDRGCSRGCFAGGPAPEVPEKLWQLFLYGYLIHTYKICNYFVDYPLEWVPSKVCQPSWMLYACSNLLHSLSNWGLIWVT